MFSVSSDQSSTNHLQWKPEPFCYFSVVFNCIYCLRRVQQVHHVWGNKRLRLFCICRLAFKMNIPTCCSTKNQERVLLNLAVILFIQRAPTSCKMPFPISSPTTPSPSISGAFYLLTEMDLCATLISQDSALMKSIFHLIIVKLLDWRDQKSRSSTAVKFHRCFGYGMPRSLGLTVALPKEPLKPLDIRISNQRGCPGAG